MDDKVIDKIEKRLRDCEKFYNIKVLCWTMRGSIGIGIHRYNSDLDLAFLFYSLDNQCHAIHDILGYGYDFLGWDIRDAVKSVIENNNQYYLNPYEDFEPIYLTSEHKRGGLNYFYALFNILGNKYSRIYLSNELDFKQSLLDSYEPKVLVEFIINPVNGIIKQIENKKNISSNDYLYSIWRILISNHILEGGLPGEEEIDPLLKKYIQKPLKDKINFLRKLHRQASSKETISFFDFELNSFIITEYENLRKKLKVVEPFKKDINCLALNDLISKLSK